jgi:hypothetical protein
MFDWVPKREKRIPLEQIEALKLRSVSSTASPPTWTR